MVTKLKPLTQYIKDLSFENFAAQKNEFISSKLDVHLDLNIKKKQIKSELIEITIVFLIEATKQDEKKFIIELSYASTFLIDKNISSFDKNKVSFVDCPTMMFPFVRQIIFNISRDSGFLPINLEPINFHDLYHSQK